ncbi:MAG: protease modulator HflC [Spirochaetes bacterium]|nr:protease modulator HflC [Spirochaetota bacterium]
MEKKINKTIIVLVVIAVLIIAVAILGPWYTLSEIKIAVITFLGKPRVTVTTAGLHLKIPIFDKVNYLPKRILEWDGEVQQFPTYDKRMILVDATVRWRIKDPLLFFESLTDELGAMARLDDILDAASREVVSKHPFEELVRNSNRINELDEKTIEPLLKQGFTREELEGFPKINVGRSLLSEQMKKYTVEKLGEYGIEVVDFFVKKVNYIDDNLKAVFGSMIAERNKIAQAYRSEGVKQREEIIGNTKKDTKVIMAEAQEKSKQIKGEADAEAAAIYNRAYNRNSTTRDFYEFIKKMEMYQKIPSNTSLIISTESEFFDMFKNY